MIRTGALLPLLGSCTQNTTLEVHLEPHYPTAQDDLDCVVYEMRNLGGSVGFVTEESEEVYTFYWFVSDTYLMQDVGYGWSRLDHENYTHGDEIRCSPFSDASEVGSTWVLIP